MATKSFNKRYPAFKWVLLVAVLLAIPLTVFSVQKVPTNTQQHAAVPSITSTPDHLPSNLTQTTYCENSTDQLAGQSAAKFSWTGVPGISQYSIYINEYPQVGSYPNGNRLETYGTSGVNTFQVPTNQLCINLNGKCGLYPGSKVMWTVAPVLSNGTDDQSNWNNVWKTFTARTCPSTAKLTVNIYLDKNGNGRIDPNEGLFVDPVNDYKPTTYITYDGISPIGNYVRPQNDMPTVLAVNHTYTLLSNAQYYVTSYFPKGYTNSGRYFAVPVYLNTNKTVNILFKPETQSSSPTPAPASTCGPTNPKYLCPKGQSCAYSNGQYTCTSGYTCSGISGGTCPSGLTCGYDATALTDICMP